MQQAIEFGVALVLFSNSFALFVQFTGIDRQMVYIPYALILLASALWWARGPNRLSWAEIGLLSEGNWKRSAASGILTGLVLAVPLVVFLAFPFMLAQPVRYREIQDLDVTGLFWRLAIEVSIATALTEEILFRGILQALFKRSLNTPQALISTNVVFALWHLAINAFSVNQNAMVLSLIPTVATQVIGYLGSLVVVGIGGLIFSVLRERTNHLAGSIVVHWVVVAAVTIVVYLR